MGGGSGGAGRAGGFKMQMILMVYYYYFFCGKRAFISLLLIGLMYGNINFVKNEANRNLFGIVKNERLMTNIDVEITLE